MKFILFMIVCGLMANYCHGQSKVKVDSLGNYVQLRDEGKQITGRQLQITFTDLQGCIYPVYETEKGKRFYVRTSKKGIEYRVYIKAEGTKDEN